MCSYELCALCIVYSLCCMRSLLCALSIVCPLCCAHLSVAHCSVLCAVSECVLIYLVC